jgi:hypothetical protein
MTIEVTLHDKKSEKRKLIINSFIQNEHFCFLVKKTVKITIGSFLPQLFTSMFYNCINQFMYIDR